MDKEERAPVRDGFGKVENDPLRDRREGKAKPRRQRDRRTKFQGQNHVEEFTIASIFSRHGYPESSSGRGWLEFPQPGKSRAGLYGGLALEEPCRICERTARDRLIPYA